MNSIRTTFRLVMAATLMIVALASSQVSAQRPGTSSTSAQDEGVYESELTGLEFTWSEDWELSSTDVSDEDEILELTSEYGYLFTGFGVYDDAVGAVEDVLSSFESDTAELSVLDEDESRGFAWSVAEISSETDDPMLVYVEVEEDLEEDFEFITVVVSPEDMFIDQYELVNDTVEMDGDALLDELDAEEVDEIVGGVATAPDDEGDVTPEADEDETETGRAGDDDVTPTSHVFEMDDIEVTVSGDVEISDIQQETVYEQVLLSGPFSIGAISLLDSPQDAEGTLESFMSGFLGEMDDATELAVESDGSVAWGLYETTSGGTDMYVYVIVNEDVYDGHYLELVAAPTTVFEDEFLAMQESVETNGVPMFDGIDVDDLLDIIDES